VDLQVNTNVSEKHTTSIFRTEVGGSMFLGNGINLQVHTVLQSRRPSRHFHRRDNLNYHIYLHRLTCEKNHETQTDTNRGPENRIVSHRSIRKPIHARINSGTVHSEITEHYKRELRSDYPPYCVYTLNFNTLTSSYSSIKRKRKNELQRKYTVSLHELSTVTLLDHSITLSA
jgi:hypothetical protein